jgi:hypothetical protein
MILSSLNLVRKISVCITSEENGEVTSLVRKIYLTIYYINDLLLIEPPDPEDSKNRGVK